jgi:glycopeptide antibiotics resistance protein
MKLWQWWVLVVIVASGPWFGIVGEPQWQRVTWIPFTGAEDKPRDVVENFLMFVPFGLSFASGRRRAHPVAAAIAASAIVSLAVEIPQLFYRLRDPSATDVFMAMCGTAAGSVATQAFQRSHARRAAGRGKTGEECCEQ